jgi:hypothetical protein
MRISIFNSLPNKGEAHKSSETSSIDEFIANIKYGKWKDIVARVREEPDKVQRNKIKRNMPSATISGVFDIRQEDKIIEHSGFICIDIDNFNDKTQLESDPFTYAIFSSASGLGLAILVRIEPDKHKESFKFLQEYYFKTYGIVVDSAPQNPASLRFVSHDPGIVVNERSRKARTLSIKPKKVQSIPIVLTAEKVDIVLQNIVNSGVNLADSYDEYMRLAFAIADGFGEGGRHYFHAIAAASAKYDSSHADKQYNIALKGNKQGITVGTFYWMAKQAGVDIPNDYKRVTQLAAIGKKSGRGADGVKAQLVQMEGISPTDADQVVDEVFRRSDVDLKANIQDREQLILALIEWISQNYNIRKNLISQQLEESGNMITEGIINTIYLKASIFFNSKEITKTLIESILFSDQIPTYNPIQEYIEKNMHRNTTGNIKRISETIESDTNMKYIFIRKWLLSVIAAYDGHPVRSVLALTGGQNTGKTYWFRSILPAALRKYYAESKLDAGKDDDILMCQKLIVMDDEMGGKSKQDEKRFKELTSKEVFSLRPPYGRANQDFKRLAILCGTSNDSEVIRDRTGNTRVLPVNVISINHSAYNEVDKDELFMEMYRAYISGEEWQLNKAELADLLYLGNEFEGINFEREMILTHLRPKISERDFVDYLTATEIKDYLELNSKQKITNLKNLSIELKSIFGKSIGKRDNGLVRYKYGVIKINNYNSNS